MRLRAAMAMLVLLAAPGWSPGAAHAHAQLERSEPEADAVVADAPAEVVLYFSEEPELRFTRVEVVTADGTRVDRDDLRLRAPDHRTVVVVSLEPGLDDGIYTVVWRALSAVDGHTTRGNFAFFVGDAPAPGELVAPVTLHDGGPPAWMAVFARSLTLVAMFGLLGLAWFPRLVLGPALRRTAKDDAVGGGLRTVLRAAAAGVAVLLVLSLLGALFVQVWTASGSGTAFWGRESVHIVRDTRFGDTWLLRAGLSAVAVAGLAAVARRPRWVLGRDAGVAGSTVSLSLLVVALLLPVTVSMNSHAAGHDDLARFGTFVDWLHAVSAGVWLGGLVMFVATLPPVLARLDGQGRLAFLATAIPRFSVVAVCAVALLVAAGIATWWLLVGDVDTTTDTAYGRTILVKSALLLPLLALGAMHLLIISPGLRQRVRRSAAEWGRFGPAFVRGVRAEVAIGALVLLVAAILANTSPPEVVGAGGQRTGIASGFAGVAVERGVEVQLIVEPAVVGSNAVDVYVKGEDGTDPAVRQILLRFAHAERDTGVTEARAEQAHPTHFTVRGSQFSIAGLWRVDVVVRQFNAGDIEAQFLVEIAP